MVALAGRAEDGRREASEDNTSHSQTCLLHATSLPLHVQPCLRCSSSAGVVKRSEAWKYSGGSTLRPAGRNDATRQAWVLAPTSW
eukprot:517032-Hanusia_phi.AAC.1